MTSWIDETPYPGPPYEPIIYLEKVPAYAPRPGDFYVRGHLFYIWRHNDWYWLRTKDELIELVDTGILDEGFVDEQLAMVDGPDAISRARRARDSPDFT